MKKALSFLIVLLVLSTCVFASHRVAEIFDPFTFQSFAQKNGEIKDKVNSKYGFGIGFGYTWEFGKGFMLGADIKADKYTFENQKIFTDISFLAKVGYIAEVNDAISLYGNMKAGLDLQICDGNAGAVLEFGPELGIEFKINECTDLFASCEGLFGFSKKDDVKYSEFRVTPAIGIVYTF